MAVTNAIRKAKVNNMWSTINANFSKLQEAVSSTSNAVLKKIVAYNPLLTPTKDVCTWTVPNTLGTTDVFVNVKEVNTNEEVNARVFVTSNNIIVEIDTPSGVTSITANTYKLLVLSTELDYVSKETNSIIINQKDMFFDLTNVSGSVTLQDGKRYIIRPTGDTTFTLPTVNSSEGAKGIKVIITNASYITDWGTNYIDDQRNYEYSLTNDNGTYSLQKTCTSNYYAVTFAYDIVLSAWVCELATINLVNSNNE